MRFAPWKVAQAAVAFVQIVRDPNQLGKVFELREHLEDPKILDPILASLRADPKAAAALREMPRLGRVDLDWLERMPEGSLGREFALHMKRQGLDPAAIPTLSAKTEYQYLSAHLYETHDIWHVVTGFATDVPGELGLQAFYYAQFPAGLSAMLLAAGLLNTTLYRIDERTARMDAIVAGYELGKKAQPFFGTRWAELWTKNLEGIRRDLGVVPVGSLEERPASPSVAASASLSA
ncbi:MAG: Coq4 family protein [Polyangiaceae bacterium]